MREVFAEYYPIDEDRLGALIETALIVVDGEVLLGLYRLHRSQANQVLDTLAALRSRLWLPYAAGRHYQDRRVEVAENQAARYAALSRAFIPPTRAELRQRVAGLEPLDPDAVTTVTDELATVLEHAADRYATMVAELADRAGVLSDPATGPDPIRSRLDHIFAGRVGARCPQSGHPDALWAEVLELADRAESVPVLFLTARCDERWYDGWLRPRPALVGQARAANPAGYAQVPLARLLESTEPVTGVAVGADTLSRWEPEHYPPPGEQPVPPSRRTEASATPATYSGRHCG